MKANVIVAAGLAFMAGCGVESRPVSDAESAASKPVGNQSDAAMFARQYVTSRFVKERQHTVSFPMFSNPTPAYLPPIPGDPVRADPQWDASGIVEVKNAFNATAQYEWHVRLAVTRDGDTLTYTPIVVQVGDKSMSVNDEYLETARAKADEQKAVEAAEAKRIAQEERRKQNTRTWTTADGQFSVEAEFAGYAAGQVSLKKPDGSTVKVALDRLSQEDQDWIAAKRKGR